MQRNVIVWEESLKGGWSESANWWARAKRRDTLESRAKIFRLIRRRRLSFPRNSREEALLLYALSLATRESHERPRSS